MDLWPRFMAHPKRAFRLFWVKNEKTIFKKIKNNEKMEGEREGLGLVTPSFKIRCVLFCVVLCVVCCVCCVLCVVRVCVCGVCCVVCVVCVLCVLCVLCEL